MKSFIVQTLLLLLLNPLATADEYYYCNCIKHHKIDVKSTTEMCRQNYMPGPDGVNATLITRQPNQDVPNGLYCSYDENGETTFDSWAVEGFCDGLDAKYCCAENTDQDGYDFTEGCPDPKSHDHY